MTLDWTSFFPPGTRVLALPNWKHPRLYLPAQSFFQNWQDSAFYPASRFLARVYRVSLRTRAAVGLGETRKVQSSHWPLGEFTREVLPEAESVVTLVGTPGPAQKITVRVLDGRGEVLAYLKYAEKEAARKRLRQECRMLHHLPGGAGPEVLKFGPFADGEALLITALTGKRLSTSLPPPEGSKDFLASLVLSAPLPLEAHPWARLVREQRSRLFEPWFEVLARKSWPIVAQHGDFAPWNLLWRPSGTVGAIDWEYGTLEGFPHLDLAYYILQISALIQRRPPSKAVEYATTYLIRQPQLALSNEDAHALTCLAAYDAYLKAREDGQPDDTKLQMWRRRIWEFGEAEVRGI
jgi:hypothetical protein